MGQWEVVVSTVNNGVRGVGVGDVALGKAAREGA